MATSIGTTTAAEATRVEDRQLPAHPFLSVRYHFGMLLGVEDFEAQQAYHRGKQRLHNAWLHGEGVVWGLGVTAPEAEGERRGELAVGPGLALDAAGNELHLDTVHCLDLSDWYEAKKEEGLLDDDEEAEVDGATEVKILARVTARYRSCLMRPVPALMEPCHGSGGDTAYSRAFETIDLRLEAGPAPEPPAAPYHRLRLLLGLDAPAATDSDQAVVDALAAIASELDPERRRLLALDTFRRCAAFDVVDLRPGSAGAESPSARFPAEDRPPVLLADVVARLRRPAGETRWSIAEIDVDNGVRPAHVSTRTIQELTAAVLLGGAVAGLESPPTP